MTKTESIVKDLPLRKPSDLMTPLLSSTTTDTSPSPTQRAEDMTDLQALLPRPSLLDGKARQDIAISLDAKPLTEYSQLKFNSTFRRPLTMKRQLCQWDAKVIGICRSVSVMHTFSG